MYYLQTEKTQIVAQLYISTMQFVVIHMLLKTSIHAIAQFNVWIFKLDNIFSNFFLYTSFMPFRKILVKKSISFIRVRFVEAIENFVSFLLIISKVQKETTERFLCPFFSYFSISLKYLLSYFRERILCFRHEPPPSAINNIFIIKTNQFFLFCVD